MKDYNRGSVPKRGSIPNLVQMPLLGPFLPTYMTERRGYGNNAGHMKTTPGIWKQRCNLVSLGKRFRDVGVNMFSLS